MNKSLQGLPSIRCLVLLPALASTAACAGEAAVAQQEMQQAAPAAPATPASAGGAAAVSMFAVSGTAVHYFSTGLIHSETATETGKVVRASEIVRLDGDLRGYLLYHPISTFDFAAGTLVNTGTQVFSGTVAGSSPVILHDNRFRFEVDLATGATRGRVFLGRSADAPHPGAWFDCDLNVVGTGLTPEGDGMADYSGTCTARGRLP